MSPISVKNAPKGINEAYKNVNHIVYKTYAYLFPMLYCMSYINTLASF